MLTGCASGTETKCDTRYEVGVKAGSNDGTSGGSVEATIVWDCKDVHQANNTFFNTVLNEIYAFVDDNIDIYSVDFSEFSAQVTGHHLELLTKTTSVYLTLYDNNQPLVQNEFKVWISELGEVRLTHPEVVKNFVAGYANISDRFEIHLTDLAFRAKAKNVAFFTDAKYGTQQLINTASWSGSIPSNDEICRNCQLK